VKKLLTLLLLLPLLIFGQVPQGVGYQGVATDSVGIELVNQSISIRASILSTSATGTIEWQEIHNTSTDTFGLFNLTIGQGISTGNGALTSFADISWGANTHFLKIEMDVNGGSNYSFMGTNQMMSVPYALYAENANIDYDSISTLLSNDSTFINNFGAGCTSFGTPQNTFNFNWTSNNQSETYFEEVQEDGFFGGQMNCAATYQGRFEVWDDTTSNSFIYNYNISNGVSTFLIPIKKGQFFKINGSCINVNFFIPLECGGGSSVGSENMIVSNFGDTLTLNGQSIIVPGISYQNYSPIFDSVTDIDGNTYLTIIINGKEWMTEDLLVSKYSDGTPIPQYTSSNNNNTSYNPNCLNPRYVYVANYGGSYIPKAYYNGYAIQAGNVCPTGWHVATEQEFSDVLDLFDTKNAAGNNYGFWWEFAAPSMKKPNSGWSVYYGNSGILGQSTNESFLSIESYNNPGCTQIMQFNNTTFGNTRIYTSTQGIYNNGNYVITFEGDNDRVSFSDESPYHLHTVRCVKD